MEYYNALKRASYSVSHFLSSCSSSSQHSLHIVLPFLFVNSFLCFSDLPHFEQNTDELIFFHYFYYWWMLLIPLYCILDNSILKYLSEISIFVNSTSLLGNLWLHLRHSSIVISYFSSPTHSTIVLTNIIPFKFLLLN